MPKYIDMKVVKPGTVLSIRTETGMKIVATVAEVDGEHVRFDVYDFGPANEFGTIWVNPNGWYVEHATIVNQATENEVEDGTDGDDREICVHPV
jgi:hypothetical protein